MSKKTEKSFGLGKGLVLLGLGGLLVGSIISKASKKNMINVDPYDDDEYDDVEDSDYEEVADEE